MTSLDQSRFDDVVQVCEDCVAITVSRSVYPPDVVIRAAYGFSDRAVAHIDEADAGRWMVRLQPLAGSTALADLGRSFCKELVYQGARALVESETRQIRDLIVAQAFAEVDFPREG